VFAYLVISAVRGLGSVDEGLAAEWPDYLFLVLGIVLRLFGMVLMTSVVFEIPGSSVTLGSNAIIAVNLFTIVGYQNTFTGVFVTVSGDPIKKLEDHKATENQVLTLFTSAVFIVARDRLL